MAIRLDESILKDIFRFRSAAENSTGELIKLVFVFANEISESGLVAAKRLTNPTGSGMSNATPQ